MLEFPQSFETARSQALARVAETMLRALGGAEVTLRLPLGVELPNSDLGLATPATEDVVLRPAVLRSLPATRTAPGARVELVVAASTVLEQAAKRNADSAEALLDSALGIVQHDRLLRIESVDVHSMADDPCFFLITATE
ncbi:MAG: hypothetical protein ACRD2R_01720 [Terriglobales bacterium]